MSTTVNVAFSDASEAEIVAWMLSPQPLQTFPYQAEISTSDSRYAAFYNANPAFQEMMPAPQ